MPENESPVVDLAKLYRERALVGDEHLTITEGNAVTWKTEFQRYHLICPSDESQGYGLLQIDDYDPTEHAHRFTRYLFDASSLVDKVTCVIPADAVTTLDRDAFDDMMFNLAMVGSDEIDRDDQDQFFTALFSVPNGS